MVNFNFMKSLFENFKFHNDANSTIPVPVNRGNQL